MITRRSFVSSVSLAGTALMMARSPGLSQENGKAKRLVFVHGRSQGGRTADAIQSEWMKALEEGARNAGLSIPADLQVDLPFYGDKLDEFAQALDVPLAQDIRARGNPADDEFLQFQASVAEQMRQGAGIRDDQVEQELGPGPRERGPLNWNWVQAILRALDRHGPGMSGKTVEIFTRDVFLYTTLAGVRDEIDRIVAPSITEAPTVVVGHSLGSVVAYNILRSDRRNLRVPLFVTLGSPLGISAIRDQFAPLRNPKPPVGSWYNAFDTRDVVALFPLDRTNFPVQPPVENNGNLRNGTDNRHGIVGYLNDATVARRILEPLSS
jgi:hypothetical protein